MAILALGVVAFAHERDVGAIAYAPDAIRELQYLDDLAPAGVEHGAEPLVVTYAGGRRATWGRAPRSTGPSGILLERNASRVLVWSTVPASELWATL